MGNFSLFSAEDGMILQSLILLFKYICIILGNLSNPLTIY